MAEIGRFFNGPSYDSQDFAEFFTNFLSTGFFNGLAVTADSATMNVTIEAGSAFIEGHEYRNTDPLTKLVGTADATNPRIDRIVVRKDSTPEAENPLQILVRAGVAATDPEPPDLVRNEGIYEISLAQVLVEAGKSFIEPSQITDERADPDVCGRVTNPSAITGQIDAIDIKYPDIMPGRYSEGFSRFYISGESFPDKLQAWMDSVGVSPSDYGRNISQLRAYVETTSNKTNTGIQTISFFDYAYTNYEYEMYGRFTRATNASPTGTNWGKWHEQTFVVEQGENANGSFIKYSNGVLECWGQPFSLPTDQTAGALYDSATEYWTLPATFDESHEVVISGDVSSINRWVSITGGISNGTVGVRAVGVTQSSSTYSVRLRAIGRWR